MSREKFRPKIFRRKPRQMVAIQWMGGNRQDVEDFLKKYAPNVAYSFEPPHYLKVSGIYGEPGYWVCVEDNGVGFVSNDHLTAEYEELKPAIKRKKST